jgi:hypothetical protein
MLNIYCVSAHYSSETFTVGTSYRHYAGKHVQTLTLSHNYLNNRNVKYLNNDESYEDNLTLRLRSVEQKTTFVLRTRQVGAMDIERRCGNELFNYTNRTKRGCSATPHSPIIRRI